MKTNQSKLLVLVVTLLAVSWTGSMIAKENPLSEIELMKLEFTLACEQTPGCVEKRKDGRASDGKDKVTFRKYKTGTKNSKHAFDVKNGANKKVD